MNPILAVDMAAVIILTTAGNARELGIDEEQWVYLRGGADCNDIWYVSERPVLHASPAVRSIFAAVSAHTGIALDEIGRFDIYSCFPSAVQVSCRELGLDPRDPRGVTVTGGLPYFGGPGNNYSLHAIAEMAHVLRAEGGHGLVTANGMYLTKHSIGLYSREAPQQAWQPIDSAPLQAAIDAAATVAPAKDPSGPAMVETFTVAFGREGPKQGIVIARNEAGERIVANTRDDEQVLKDLLDNDPIGQTGRVTVENGINRIAL
ncbi:MAG: acetyl-CoA acetyltransferase, partial [Halioglobus sp.]|nr:acetyl-CoA acetyltransferase [Halioglobus sp.]